MAKQTRKPCLNCGMLNPNSKHVRYCSDSCYMDHYSTGKHNKPPNEDQPALPLEDDKRIYVEKVLFKQAKRKVFWLRMIGDKEIEQMKPALRQYIDEYLNTDKHKMLRINLDSKKEEVVDNTLTFLRNEVKRNPEMAILDVEYLHEGVMDLIHKKFVEVAKNLPDLGTLS